MTERSGAIWPYQMHFWASVKVAAESVFNKLDPRLAPNVFLMAIPTDLETEAGNIRLEPTDFEVDARILTGVLSRAKELQGPAPAQSGVFRISDLADERHRRRLQRKSLRIAVGERLASTSAERNAVVFCSIPAEINKYFVFVVLELDRTAVNAYYSLTRDKMEGYPDAAQSFIHAAGEEFLEVCLRSLTSPDPGTDLSVLERESEYVLVNAAKRLVNRAAFATDRIEGTHTLYDDCNYISMEMYEGRECSGRMIVASPGHPSVRCEVLFETPVALSRAKAARKLIEMSSGGLCVLCDGGAIYGMGRALDTYDLSKEDMFAVKFSGHGCWQLMHGGRELLNIHQGRPALPFNRLDEARFRSHFKRVFPYASKKDADKVWMLVDVATLQKCGTIIVVTDEAQAEASRLGTQGIPVRSVKLTAKTISALTSIDGALLLSPQGTCYGIGIILDGLAARKGDSGRGARYNSAVRYVQTRSGHCFAVVVSADGKVDLVPDLKPQIPKSVISEAIAGLERIADSPTPEMREYYRTMKTLDKHRFYLLPEMCEKVNRLKESIEEKAGDETVKYVFPPFIPDEEMNESYFLR